MKKKKVLIFGITGQDGGYLSKFLLSKNYKVFGITRSKKKSNLMNLEKLEIKKKINLILSKNLKKDQIDQIISKTSPDEIYYLAGQSSVGLSFKDPIETYVSNNLSLFYILDYCRKYKKKTKVYNSVSSECFGNNKKIFCNEKTPFNPISPYGRAKSFSFWLMKYYRDNFRINASNGILFNHESPLRNKDFVTGKIISYTYNYKKNKKKKLILGDINISRDWGWANDYVKAIYLINSNKKNDDYVIGSGKYNSLKNFVKIIFKEKNLPLTMIRQTKKFKRKNEIKKICADVKKIKKELNWKTNHTLKDIAQKLVYKELY